MLALLWLAALASCIGSAVIRSCGSRQGCWLAVSQLQSNHTDLPELLYVQHISLTCTSNCICSRRARWHSYSHLYAHRQCVRTLACAGFSAISVLVQRPQAAPVRCGFWRASATAPDESTALPRLSPAKPSFPAVASDSTVSHPGLPRAPSSGQVQSGSCHVGCGVAYRPCAAHCLD